MFAIILAAMLLAGCGPRAVDVAGTWDGAWVSADGESRGAFRVNVRQRGKTIGGEIELSLDWLPAARIEGVVEGQRVRWGVLRGNLVVLTFEGDVDRETARGTYTIASAAQGSWSARRVQR